MPTPSTSYTVALARKQSHQVSVFLGLAPKTVQLGGMYFVFTTTVPFFLSIGSALAVSKTSNPIIASAFPVSISGDSTLVTDPA